MLVHCDKPDLLLAYIGGAAGRVLIHTIMLSPEVHTWDPTTEQRLQAININDHATIKLNYIKESIFPEYLSHCIHQWKKHEPVPWGCEIEMTKKVIRHCWMQESHAALQRFECSKLAFVDYHDSMYFIIRAGAEKKTHKVIDQPPISQRIIVEQLHKAQQCLERWYGYAQDFALHKIDLGNFFFRDLARFKQEYYALCEYYQVTPMLSQATLLRQHWLSLQWRRNARI